MTSNVPTDFPRDPFPSAVSGVQPKLAARKIDGRYVVGLTDEELWGRYDVCADLVRQLIPYGKRKQCENPTWTQADVVLRLANGVRSKEWGLSPQEIDWIVEKVADALG